MSRTRPDRSLVRRALNRVRRMGLSALGRTRFGSVTHVATDEAAVALTFDGGPDERWTPRVLELLARHGAKATFFVIGKYVEKHPEIVDRASAEGHALGNHTWDHPSFPLVSSAERRSQVRRCEAVLAPHPTATTLFRPPYCEQSLASRADVLRVGHDVVMASLSAKDWEDRDAAFIRERLDAGMRPGQIILLHDAVCDQRYRSREQMLDALDGFLERWKDSYAFVTLPELFRLGRVRRTIWLRPPDTARFATYDRAL